MGQYVGARYVPDVTGSTYDPTQAYENLVVVDNGMGTSYISRKPVPAGIPLSNTEYWALYGASNGAIIYLQNQIGNLDNLNTTDKDCLVDAINENVSEILALAKRTLNPRDFGAICDKDTDDSQSLQDLFDFAYDNKVTEVNFDGIDEIAFKNIEIKSDVTINFGSCKIYGLLYTEKRVHNMFLINSPNINVTFDGGEFIGKGDDAIVINPTATPNRPIIDVTTANSITIKNGNYHNINNTNEGVLATTPVANRYSTLFRVHDCKFTSICNNKFSKNYGDELMFIVNINSDREEVNAEIKNNYFGATYTSSINFIGNHIEISGNTYDYNYNGSIVNCMGLDVCAHDETFNGVITNCYDNCENDAFQGVTFKIENIEVKEVTYFTMFAANIVDISNVHIKQVGAHVTTLAYVYPGYGADPSLHPDVGVTELTSCNILIDNCNLENLDGNAGFLIDVSSNTLQPLVCIKNCISPKITGSTRYSPLLSAKNCDVKFSNCVLYARLDTNFSATSAIVLFVESAAILKTLSFIDCVVRSNVTAYDASLCSAPLNSGVKAIVAGNIADSNLNFNTIVSGGGIVDYTESGNFGFTT